MKVIGNPDQETSHDCICVSYRNFVNDLGVGSDILIDDGDLELKVIEKKEDFLVCEVENDATLGSRKSVNVPGVRINLPSLTEKDRNNILYAIEKDIDLSLTLSCAIVRMYLIFVRFWMLIIVTLRLLPRLKIRKA